MIANMHREDIKAGLRKRYGTVRAFEIAHGLPRGAVTEILRSRKWRRVEDAVERALAAPKPKEGAKP